MSSSREEWREPHISELIGIVEVSSRGRIRSLPRAVNSSHGAMRTIHGRVLKGTTDAMGYLITRVTVSRKAKDYKTHRLVAGAFVPGDVSLCVNHINGDKRDNRPENLEWVTFAENMRHAWQTGLIRHGDEHSSTKVSDALARQVAREFVGGAARMQLARKYGLRRGLVDNIVTGRRRAAREIVSCGRI